jgi:hypothetical protein
MLITTYKTGYNMSEEWTEPGLQNKCFSMLPLDDDCQVDRKQDGWRP